MFHNISSGMLARMQELEQKDAADRIDGTARKERLRQIPAETGKFLAIQCRMAPRGRVIEIGTSAGYSTLWIALACGATNRQITTFEILPEKAKLARATFELAGVTDVVELIEGDAIQHIENVQDVAFCFLDAEKEIYRECYDLLVPRMVPGGLLIADNAINHAATLAPMINNALQDPRLDALVVPIGKGVLLCRKHDPA
jgi:caffeoyl-CoA O-methyltransferase